jgi:hypothetical protein
VADRGLNYFSNPYVFRSKGSILIIGKYWRMSRKKLRETGGIPDIVYLILHHPALIAHHSPLFSRPPIPGTLHPL